MGPLMSIDQVEDTGRVSATALHDGMLRAPVFRNQAGKSPKPSTISALWSPLTSAASIETQTPKNSLANEYGSN